MLADNPGLTPNQVKARLLGNTDPGPVGNPFVDGHGALDAYAAATSGPMNFNQSAASLKSRTLTPLSRCRPPAPVDTWNTSLWSGISWNQPPSLSRVMERDGVERPGLERLGLGRQGVERVGLERRSVERRRLDGCAWNNGAWSGSAWDGSAWDGDAWNSSAWS